MADQTVRGRFVWHELMTPDTAGAHAFYSKVLGWKSQAWEQDPAYSMFAASSGPLGGSVALPNGAPHWLHYIGTPDINATVQQAKGLGAKVTQDVKALPNGGKYATLADPQGAVFALYESSTPPEREAAPKRGEFSWHELATSDQQAALQFYSALFGWERMSEHDMGPEGTYLVFGSNGMARGGIFKKPAAMPGAPAWLGYVRVKDVQQSVKKVKSARGTLVNGPMEVPGGDWIAQFVDPYGAMFAVHAVAADVAAGKPAAAAEPAAAAAPAEKPEQKSAPKPAPRKAAQKPAAAAKKAAATKKAAAAKPAAKPAAKRAGGKKKAAKKARPAAKAAKRPARKAAKSAGGRKKAAKSAKRPAARKSAKRPRKAK